MSDTAQTLTGVVVIGAGRMGHIHARSAALHPHTALRYVVTATNSPAGQSLAAEWGAQATADLGAALADPAVGIVVVCSPSDAHLAHVTASLAAGKAVLCEKPLGLTEGEINAMFDAAEAAGAPLEVAFQRRWDADFVALKEADVGAPHVIRLTSRDHPPPSTDNLAGGGSFFADFSIHDLDMANFLLGDGADPVEHVWAGASSFLPNYAAAGLDDTAVVVLQARSGAIVVIDNSRRTSYGYDIRAEVHGARGTAEVVNPRRSNLVLKGDGGRQEALLHHSFPERFEAAYRAEFASLVDVARGRPGAALRTTRETNLAAARLAARCDEARARQAASAPAPPAPPAEFAPLDAGAVVGVAIIGAGRMGRVRADAVRAHPELARVAVVADVYQPAVDECAAAWGCDGVHLAAPGALAGVLARDDVQAVFCCTTTSEHVGVIKAAAAAGKHVFVEKPMAPTQEEAAECAAAAAAGRVHLYTGFQRRCDVQFRELLQVENPELLRFSARDSAVHNSIEYLLTSGHQVYDSLIHEIDWALWMAGGAKPVEVYGRSASFNPAMQGKEDCVVGVVRFDNGALASLDNHRCSQFGYDQRGEAHGAARTVSVDNVVGHLATARSAAGIVGARALDNGIDRYRAAYEAGVVHFLRSIRGEEEPRLRAADCVLHNAVADALIESMGSGSSVVLS